MKRKIIMYTVVIGVVSLGGFFLWENYTNKRYPQRGFLSKNVIIPDESISCTFLEERNIAISIVLYKRAFDKFPEGDSSNIGKALTGENPLNIVLSRFRRIGNDGSFLDPQGIPYDISITDSGYIRIRSAGVNKIKGDADDEVLEDEGIQSEEWWSLMESAIVGSEIEQEWAKVIKATGASEGIRKPPSSSMLK